MLGVGIILVLGGAITLLATFLEQLLDLVSCVPSIRDNQHFRYAHIEWKASSTLQLQRLAHENLDMGSWSNTEQAVPVTELGDVLAILDISNPNHVRLVRPGFELRKLLDRDKNATLRSMGSPKSDQWLDLTR